MHAGLDSRHGLQVVIMNKTLRFETLCTSTLNAPNIVSHGDFLELMLDIWFFSVGHITYFCRINNMGDCTQLRNYSEHTRKTETLDLDPHDFHQSAQSK